MSFVSKKKLVNILDQKRVQKWVNSLCRNGKGNVEYKDEAGICYLRHWKTSHIREDFGFQLNTDLCNRKADNRSFDTMLDREEY